MRSLVVWRFSDGKAGHDHQSQGLIEALARLQSVETFVLDPLSAMAALSALLGKAPAIWRDLPTPDLVIGAGHRTHLSLLAARRVKGGKIIVSMRPSLPFSWFDLCLIPAHDAPPNHPNVLITRGVLNHVQPSATLEPDRGLFLIGGPSAHFGWDHSNLYQQIAAILAADNSVHWTLTTSRRTPQDFLERLTSSDQLQVVPVTATGPDWLPAQLARAGQVWVTADSVSMVYEALTAGAAVGVLEVPHKQSSRVSRGLEQLAKDGWVKPFSDWRQSPILCRPRQTFNEAERCAHWISNQWFA